MASSPRLSPIILLEKTRLASYYRESCTSHRGGSAPGDRGAHPHRGQRLLHLFSEIWGEKHEKPGGWTLESILLWPKKQGKNRKRRFFPWSFPYATKRLPSHKRKKPVTQTIAFASAPLADAVGLKSLSIQWFGFLSGVGFFDMFRHEHLNQGLARHAEALCFPIK